MTSLELGRHIVIFALSLSSAVVAFGQTSPASLWHSAQESIAAKEKVEVITIAHPSRRHTCHVAWINASQITCSHLGHTTVYQAGDVEALIEPGSHTNVLLWVVGVLAAAGTATWGTVVLAGVCPICAVGTGIVAGFLYIAAPGVGMMSDGDSEDKLLYLAPGQSLQVRLN